MKTLIVNRKITLSIFVVMLLISGMQGMSYAQDAPDDTIVEFADVNLATAVREALELDTGDEVDILKIPKVELEKLTTLSASQLSITYLSGLEHATQLKELYLVRNNISNLTPLAQLTQLITLSLGDNNIRNLTPLAQLTKLTSLSLYSYRGRGNNTVSDLTPLTQLTQLTTLNLFGNSVSDITPLAQLTELTGLNLSDNHIRDITPLAQLTKLTWLHLSDNHISDLTPLAQLKHLASIFANSYSGHAREIPLIQVSAAQPLVEATLNGSSVTITLLPSGTSFDASTDIIRNALTVSGVEGVTVSEVIRVSDTKVNVTFAFAGSFQDDAVMSFSLDEDAVSGYEGRALTGKHIPVYARAPLTVSTNYPLRAATLDGTVVTLTMNSEAFNSRVYGSDFKDVLTISGITGITFVPTWRDGATQRNITLRFKGNVDADTVLTFTLSPKAIKNYNGPPFTAELPVTATVNELQVLLPELQGQPMFWVNTNTGRIETTEYFDAVTNGVTVLTVDRTGEKLYWAERGKSGGIIKRADFDGRNVEELVSLSSVPRGIAIDTVESKLYWTNSDMQIQTADLNGENISTVIQLEEEILEETIVDCTSHFGFLFWYDICSEEIIHTNLTSPTDIAVNTEDGRLYWTEFSGRIRRVNPDGTGLDTLVPDIGSPYGITVAGRKIYWAEEVDERQGKIQRANFNGTNIETLATGQGLPTGISVDTTAGKVYWTNSLLGEIQRTDLSGGEVEVVAIGITAPGDFVLVTDTQQTPPITEATTDATVSISPASVTSPAIGQQLEFSLNITNGKTVAGYQATVQFDDITLRYVSGANGDFLPADAYFVEPVVEGNLVQLNAVSLAGETDGDGTLATLTFEVSAAKLSTLTLSDVLLTNSAGEAFVPQIENAQITEPTKLKEDINGDDIVNIQDLVLVVSNLGKSGQSAADVNGDNIVNIQDLVLVAGALDTSAAAPSLDPQLLSTLAAADVKLWLSQAQQLTLTDTASLRGIQFLEQLLTAMTPKKTALLANYPNPFNPETWIPYQLATPSEVTITIYDIRGRVVRTLILGNQPAGVYRKRSKAAHWDGRNHFGEKVATGVYFYTLTAGDFSATRKMLIRK